MVTMLRSIIRTTDELWILFGTCCLSYPKTLFHHCEYLISLMPIVQTRFTPSSMYFSSFVLTNSLSNILFFSLLRQLLQPFIPSVQNESIVRNVTFPSRFFSFGLNKFHHFYRVSQNVYALTLVRI